MPSQNKQQISTVQLDGEMLPETIWQQCSGIFNKTTVLYSGNQSQWDASR